MFGCPRIRVYTRSCLLDSPVEMADPSACVSAIQTSLAVIPSFPETTVQPSNSNVSLA
jgi:hypothetical protein